MKIRFRLEEEGCNCTECDGKISIGDSKCLMTLGEVKNILCHDCYEQLQEDLINSYGDYIDGVEYNEEE